MVSPRAVLGGVAVAGTLAGLACLPILATPGAEAPPPAGIGDLPDGAAHAYWNAPQHAPVRVAGRSLPWWLLAGIGEVESAHGGVGGSSLDVEGVVAPPIIGPSVPGLADTDGGRWDQTAVEDRAVGPMQLLPSTWVHVAQDGNGDGIADPHNLYDAALAAADVLCRAAGSLDTAAQQRRGLLAYNHSNAYVDQVLAAAARYRGSAGSAELVEVPGIGLTAASWAAQVRALLAAAGADGVELSGRSYRDRAAQVLLRRQHCGSSSYAIYDMPAGECDPPTARPGTSLHERGLAIDFDHCRTRDTECFRWLAANAASYGLRNLPSEPWHWSIDGT
jgi:hypothetical protein